MTSLFCLQYDGAQLGCPPYLSGEFNHSEFEWEPLDPHAVDATIVKEYRFRSKVKGVDFDFYGPLRLVSKEFLDLCEAEKVGHRAVPVSISLPGGGKSAKDYFILLLRGHISALDRDRSKYIDATDPRTGEELPNRLYPGAHLYDRIDRFVAADVGYPSLFVCVETTALVCTEHFKREAEARALKGLKFQRIDDAYTYDPFAGL